LPAIPLVLQTLICLELVIPGFPAFHYDTTQLNGDLASAW